MQDVWILSIIRDEQEWDLRCVQASACVLVPHWMTPPPFLFAFSSSSWRSLKHSSYGFSSPSSLLLNALSSLRGVSSEAFQECSINVRAEEPRVRVSFHQPVNYLLSFVKALHGGSLDVLFDLLSSVIVNVDLFRWFCFDELLINLLSPWRHSKWRLNLLVVLTSEPKFYILITVFWFKEVSKCGQSIFRFKKPFQRLWPLLGIF